AREGGEADRAGEVAAADAKVLLLPVVTVLVHAAVRPGGRSGGAVAAAPGELARPVHGAGRHARARVHAARGAREDDLGVPLVGGEERADIIGLERVAPRRDHLV